MRSSSAIKFEASTVQSGLMKHVGDISDVIVDGVTITDTNRDWSVAADLLRCEKRLLLEEAARQWIAGCTDQERGWVWPVYAKSRRFAKTGMGPT